MATASENLAGMIPGEYLDCQLFYLKTAAGGQPQGPRRVNRACGMYLGKRGQYDQAIDLLAPRRAGPPRRRGAPPGHRHAGRREDPQVRRIGPEQDQRQGPPCPRGAGRRGGTDPGGKAAAPHRPRSRRHPRLLRTGPDLFQRGQVPGGRRRHARGLRGLQARRRRPRQVGRRPRPPHAPQVRAGREAGQGRRQRRGQGRSQATQPATQRAAPGDLPGTRRALPRQPGLPLRAGAAVQGSRAIRRGDQGVPDRPQRRPPQGRLHAATWANVSRPSSSIAWPWTTTNPPSRRFPTAIPTTRSWPCTAPASWPLH